MEEKIFPSAAVAAELERFVEARLHTDGGPRMDENNDLQKKLAGTVALPGYVIVDPTTGEKLRLRFGFMKAERFIEFLRGK